ncbi:diguanylate cyclase [Methylobacterium platani]|uniref:Diguanylate cyclase n=1 Tax=Methylobacterium platani TaxID=427683 RepID=A0A179SN15_9HYPH|nr:diguanylate cyclase [Methylobacterium platani]
MRRRGRNLGLGHRLWITAIALAASLLALTALVVAPSVTAYRDSRDNLARVSRLGQVFAAANRLSAERGPANVAMSIPPGSDPAALARLAAFRAASDGALAALGGLEAPTADAALPTLPYRFLAATAARLAEARQDVDRVAGLPAAERSLDDMTGAIARMIAAVDTFQDAVAWEIREIGLADPSLAGPALIAHVVSDLREYGGRIGSAIIPAVAVHHPLNAAQLSDARQMRGRILEMLRLLRGQAAFGPGQPYEALFAAVETTFAGRGLALIEATIAEGRGTGRYSLTADELTHRYVPALKPVEALRDRYLAGLIEGFSAERDAMRRRLVAVAVGGAVVLALLVALLHSLSATVLRPLLVAREIVVALSRGDALRDSPPPGGPARPAAIIRITGIRRLFEALAVLEERLRERARLMETLRRQAETDGLTGMSNRRGLALAMAQAAAAPEGPAAALMIDLDGFKKVNDALGHEAGDILIRQAGERLGACIGGDGLVARMGGDEFAILLPGRDGPAAEAAAETILHSLSEPFAVEGQTIHLGASIGIALSPRHGPLTDALLACADMALYEAKRAGRHCHRLFTPALRDATLSWTARQQELPRALAAGEFALVYQPQVDLRDRRILGAEALIRWRHPRLGLLAPGEFLAPLEASRLAAPVGRWVLRTACAQAAAWRSARHPAGAPDLRVSVNLFGAQFHSASLVDEVRAALADSGLPGSALELEITETIILQHDEALIAPLRALRDLGIGLAFDDFGTGYASLSLLKRFPLTRLKIDRSFVQGMDASPQDRAIVQSVLSLGRSFGLAVTAEGVETEAAARRLRAKGCEEAQGYLFGRPMEAAAFEALIRDGERRTA